MEEGALIREAIDQSIEQGIFTVDIAGDAKSYSTTEVGEWVVKYIQNK